MILIAHVALTTWLSYVLSMRVDEAYSFHTTSMGLTYAVHQALVWEFQPPLFFALLELWRHLGQSIFFARLLSVIAVALGVYVVGLVAKRYLSEYHRAWAMAIVAFNPFVIASAVDARVYGFVFLWSALLLWLFFKAFLNDERDVRMVAAFTVVAVAAVYTQYYLGFVLVGLAAALILTRRWRDVGTYIACMIVVGLSLLPLLHFVGGEVGANVINNVNNRSFAGNAALLTTTLAHMVVPVDYGTRRLRYVAYAIALIFVIAMVWRSDKARLRALLWAPAATLVVATLAFVSAVTIAHMPITVHYSAAFYVPSTIVLLALISAVPGMGGRRAIAAASIALVLSSLLSLTVDYRALAKSGDAKRVAAFVMAHESPGQKIAVFDAQNALPLAYYYKGPNVIVPIPRPVRYDRFLTQDIAIDDTSEVQRALGYPAGRGAQIWLVSPNNDKCKRKPVDLHCEFLYSFIAQHYETLLDQKFYFARARLLSER